MELCSRHLGQILKGKTPIAIKEHSGNGRMVEVYMHSKVGVKTHVSVIDQTGVAEEAVTCTGKRDFAWKSEQILIPCGNRNLVGTT